MLRMSVSIATVRIAMADRRFRSEAEAGEQPPAPSTRSRPRFGQLRYCDNPNHLWVEAVAVPLVVFNHIIYRGRRVADIPRELLKLLSTAEHATPERLVTVNVKLAE